MVLHVLYLEKENGNVLYHLPEKRVVTVEKQIANPAPQLGLDNLGASESCEPCEFHI